MKTNSSGIDAVLSILNETPGRLSNLIMAFDDRHLYSPPGVKTWSVSEILAHMRACADIWTFSIYAMLTEKEPILPDINERKWAKVMAYARLPIIISLQAFTFQREGLLRVLKPLPKEGWEHGSLIMERKHTVFTQARRMAYHEQDHLEQIEDLLKQTNLQKKY